MAEPFKNLLNGAVVQCLAEQLSRTAAGFDRARFCKQALRDLDTLEMKERCLQMADALQATLPEDFATAAAAIEAALAPAAEHTELGQLRAGPAGLAGWALWPVGEYVARCGLPHPERALALLCEVTQRFTAEFAIRPFIAEHPALSLAALASWVSHPNPHVRRLVSEGSRPRLPWGMQLKALMADPSPTLPLLRALQDDRSDYVRRSVANHLNDIAKDHPSVVARWVEEHLPGAGPERRALLRHASRTLIKQGDARVLKAFGLGTALRGSAQLTLAPRRVTVGGEVLLTLQLQSTSSRKQKLAVDYVVHHVKAGGHSTPKVFKGWTLDLPPRATVTLTKRHSMRVVTTRRYHAGRHEVDVQINGQRVAQSHFMLRLPAEDTAD